MPHAHLADTNFRPVKLLSAMSKLLLNVLQMNLLTLLKDHPTLMPLKRRMNLNVLPSPIVKNLFLIHHFYLTFFCFVCFHILVSSENLEPKEISLKQPFDYSSYPQKFHLTSLLEQSPNCFSIKKVY